MKIRNNNLSNRSIDISTGVTVHLYKAEYDKLVNLLLPDMKEQIKWAQKAETNAEKKRDECWELVTELRELFYDCSCDFAILRDIKDIDEKQLMGILDRYSQLLGFV